MEQLHSEEEERRKNRHKDEESGEAVRELTERLKKAKEEYGRKVVDLERKVDRNRKDDGDRGQTQLKADLEHLRTLVDQKSSQLEESEQKHLESTKEIIEMD